MGGACSAYGGNERRIQGFGGGNLRERDHLGRPRRRWEDKMDLQEVGCGGIDWMKLAQDTGYGQVAGTCECGNEPSVSIKCGEFLDWLNAG